MKTAFIGLGVMGYPMAGHLKKGGHDVVVYNRNPAKAKQWKDEYGGDTAPTPAEAASKVDIVFCCVGRDSDLRQVTLGGKRVAFAQEGSCLRLKRPAKVVPDQVLEVRFRK